MIAPLPIVFRIVEGEYKNIILQQLLENFPLEDADKILTYDDENNPIKQPAPVKWCNK